ncbi:MAG: AraC family transcriptional regulator [Bacillota bacterium]|nr:AraC family transcriptional regulator [Bacillota bacterium]
MKFSSLPDVYKKLPFFVEAIGFDYQQKHIERLNGYPYFQWIGCTSGEGVLKTGRRKLKVKKDYGMLLFPNEKHTYYPVSDDWNVNFITFSGFGVMPLLQSFGINHTDVLFVLNPTLINTKIKLCLNTANSNRKDKNIRISEFLYGLLLSLGQFARVAEDRTFSDKSRKLDQVLIYIENNYNLINSLQDLSCKIGVSDEHLCYLFKKHLKIRPFEYINSIKIAKSKDMMISNKELKIADIAKAVGFSDTSYYCSTFKKIEGITPGAFKKLY